jgi:hypothetical protein
MILLTCRLAWAELPPEMVKERLSNAEEVLSGTILNIHNAPNDWAEKYFGKNVIFNTYKPRIKYFDLEIEKVQKTTRGFKSGDIIKIAFADYKGQLLPPGSHQLKCKKNDRVSVFLRSDLNLGQDIFREAVDGCSVDH